jgi:hypothetical protein
MLVRMPIMPAGTHGIMLNLSKETLVRMPYLSVGTHLLLFERQESIETYFPGIWALVLLNFSHNLLMFVIS